jgi:hypothetical protein
MKLILSILLSGFFLIFKKDPPLSNQINAQQYNDTTHYAVGDTTYNTPRFNPNNSNEII